MHVRMQSHENVEISNPMYLREEPDEDAESLDPTFVIPASTKVSQFSHIPLEWLLSLLLNRRPTSLTQFTNRCTTIRQLMELM